MTTKHANAAAIVAVALSLAACAPAEDRHRGDLGEADKTAGGTLPVPLIGSQIGGGSGRIADTVAGTLIGGFIGHPIGQQLDRDDVEQARLAQQRAYRAPIGQQITWNNPDSGHGGTITPTRDRRDAAGRTCREYQTTLTIGGETEKAYGTPCREPDCSWQVVNN